MRYAAPLFALLLRLLPGAGPAPAQNDLRQELLRLINAERRSKGAPPLRHSHALSQVAHVQPNDKGDALLTQLPAPGRETTNATLGAQRNVP